MDSLVECFARLKGVRLSAYKARLVADQVRGKPVEEALHILRFSPRRAAAILRKVVNSALANAEHNEGMDADTLQVHTVYIDEGPKLKRIRPRARGRPAPIRKPSCHITVGLSDGAD